MGPVQLMGPRARGFSYAPLRGAMGPGTCSFSAAGAVRATLGEYLGLQDSMHDIVGSDAAPKITNHGGIVGAGKQ